MASIVIFFHIVVFSNAIAQLNSNSIIDLNSQLKNTEVVIDSLLNIRRSVYEYSMNLTTRIDSLKDSGNFDLDDLVTAKLKALTIGNRLEEIDDRLEKNRVIENNIRRDLCKAHDLEMEKLLKLMENSFREDGALDIGVSVLFSKVHNKRDLLGDCFNYPELGPYEDLSIEKEDSPDEIRLKLAFLDYAEKEIDLKIKKIESDLVRLNRRFDKIEWINGRFESQPHSKHQGRRLQDYKRKAKHGYSKEERGNTIESLKLVGLEPTLENLHGFLHFRIKKTVTHRKKLLRIREVVMIKETQLEKMLSNMLERSIELD